MDRNNHEGLAFKGIKPDVSVDTVGKVCPQPLIAASLKMKELTPGQVLEILADDPGVLRDIPTWCKNSGNKFLKLARDEEIYRFYVQKMDHQE